MGVMEGRKGGMGRKSSRLSIVTSGSFYNEFIIVEVLSCLEGMLQDTHTVSVLMLFEMLGCN